MVNTKIDLETEKMNGDKREPQLSDKLIHNGGEAADLNNNPQNGYNDDLDDNFSENKFQNSVVVKIESNASPSEKRKFTIFGYRPSQIKWTNVILLAFIHALAVVGYVYLALYPVKFWSVWWTIFVGLFSAFGMSVGAHRLWAHRSFKARWILRLFLVIIETFSMNGGCYSFARDHRCHHKFVDTIGDPKNAKRGFFFSHIGWWMLKKNPDMLRMSKKLNHRDLDNEPLIVWQKRLYVPLFLLIGVVVPTLVPYFIWDEDIWTAFFIASVLRTVVVMHQLWTVNSIAHLRGPRPYNRDISPSDSKLTMYLSLGEGIHNYHHAFPMDYANCKNKWWEVFNPSTLFVDICSLLGLAYDLKKPSPEVIKGTVSRNGEPVFYEKNFIQHKTLFQRIIKGLQEWSIGLLISGWSIYPAILFKIITGRPLFVF